LTRLYLRSLSKEIMDLVRSSRLPFFSLLEFWLAFRLVSADVPLVVETISLGSLRVTIRLFSASPNRTLPAWPDGVVQVIVLRMQSRSSLGVLRLVFFFFFREILSYARLLRDGY